MKTFCYQLLSLFFMAGLLTESSRGHVKSIKAETKEGLIITVWVEDEPIRVGKDIEIQFRIDNKGPKTIYLVSKENLEINVRNNELAVNPFTVGPDEFGGTDYSFLQVKKGGAHRGKFIIPAQKIDGDGVRFVEVGLAFVDEIQGLQPRKPGNSDPVAFRGLLAQRAISIMLGKLYLLVE